MNDEEIMKRFNASLAEDNKQTPVTPYHATGNLNTAIGNPNINVNDPMNVNIQNGGLNTNNTSSIVPPVDLLKPESQISNGVPVEEQPSTNFNNNSNVVLNLNQPSVATNMNGQGEQQSALQNTNYQPDVTEQYIPNQELQGDQVYKTTTYISTQPSMTQKKKKTVKLTLSPETKIAMVIALILFIFIMVMPTIYDFIRNIRF